MHQATLESIVRTDLFTGLQSEEYLYGEGKRIIDQYTISTICMFKITNIEEINKNYCRELGNEVIKRISAYIQDNISEDYVFVRYMGPKFVIAFSGVNTEGVASFINDIKDHIEQMKISLPEGETQYTTEEPSRKNIDMTNQVATPIINVALSSYYKGTGLEEVLKKLEEYLDNADKQESDITNI